MAKMKGKHSYRSSKNCLSNVLDNSARKAYRMTFAEVGGLEKFRTVVACELRILSANVSDNRVVLGHALTAKNDEGCGHW